MFTSQCTHSALLNEHWSWKEMNSLHAGFFFFLLFSCVMSCLGRKNSPFSNSMSFSWNSVLSYPQAMAYDLFFWCPFFNLYAICHFLPEVKLFISRKANVFSKCEFEFKSYSSRDNQLINQSNNPKALKHLFIDQINAGGLKVWLLFYLSVNNDFLTPWPLMTCIIMFWIQLIHLLQSVAKF